MRALPGQCLRVSDLPRQVLERLALRLVEAQVPGVEVYLVDRVPGPQLWRVGVHKVVERRNAEEGVVLALFPPDLQLAAGDSVDISTFRTVPVGDLDKDVSETLQRRIPPALKHSSGAVLDYLRLQKWPLTSSSRLTFLATIAEQATPDARTVGGALFALGLVPDFALLEQPDELHYRLGQRNLPVVEALRDPGATPIERILRLPLASTPQGKALRQRLLTFFKDHPSQDITAWGGIVATNPEWRDLSLDQWVLSTSRPSQSLKIEIEPLKLPRSTQDSGMPLLDASSRPIVAWRTTPKPLDVPGLDYFRIELLSADRLVVWESALLKRGTNTTARRSRTIKEGDLAGLDSGVYFFRVVALNTAGDPFPAQDLRDPDGPADGKRANESEDFLLVTDAMNLEEQGGVEPVTNVFVANFAEAEMRARWAAIGTRRGVEAVRPISVEWVTPQAARGETATASIAFDIQRQYNVRFSQRLRLIEGSILAAPEQGGHYNLFIGPTPDLPKPISLDLPAEVAATRRELFEAFAPCPPGNGTALVSLIDLHQFSAQIDRYARAYQSWLENGDENALRLDIIVAEISGSGKAILVSPTHPLRLLWCLQEQQLARSWTAEAALRKKVSKGVTDTWRDALSPQGIPAVITLGPEEGFVDAGPLLGGWEAYLPTGAQESRSILALLRQRLGSGSAHHSEADLPPRLLADKLEMFLRQHPYTPSLIINVINPGDAGLVVDSLLDLEKRRAENLPSVRYVVRLFTNDLGRDGIGQAFRELADPERQISEVADRLVAPGKSFLFPKLSWSRNSLAEFRATPERFTAHITLLLDSFGVELRVARTDPTERSSFIHGLVQEAPRRFTGRGATYRWIRRPAPAGCTDLVEAPGRSLIFADLLIATGALQAHVLAPNSNTNHMTAVASLDLDGLDQSLLYSAHAVSAWVLTVDANLGLEYFDGAGRADRPGYLLDFTPEFVSSGGRQLLLTTRMGEEIADIMGPATSQVGLDQSVAGAQMLIEALRSLSGRLALKLLSSPAQIQGALGMALARLFVEAYGLAEAAIIVPLDAHPELTTPMDELSPRLRGDLLLVSADHSRRHLDFLLVEVKCRAGEGLGAELRAGVMEQLGNSERVLRERFDPSLENEDRIDRVVQSWQLTNVLNFYLDRAVRYSLINGAAVADLRHFFSGLDGGYSLTVRKTGLVFRLEGQASFLDQEEPEVPIWVVGREAIFTMVSDALRTFVEQRASETEANVSILQTTQGIAKTDPLRWHRIRQTFAGPNIGDDLPPRSATAGDISELAEEPGNDVRIQGEVETAGQERGHRAEPMSLVAEAHSTAGPEVVKEPIVSDVDLITGSSQSTIEMDESSRLNKSEAENQSTVLGVNTSQPHYDVLLGEARVTPQYGLIGTVATEPWRKVALDLNGCNTISVFGVQGAGKSYTVGSILEMAAMPIPNLNALPQPLAAVVFHYHQTQDYPPEFVSMNRPNSDQEQIETLAQWEVQPAGLDDVLVLTTADTVDLRQREFPRATVEPIAFSSAELTIADWRFLMGATGNDSLYLKLVNEVMRKNRANLTLKAIQDGLVTAPMSETHRSLAETRLEFASRFIDDNRSLRSLLLPGRLVVVDLRDEFIEKEQALGLFVTMLNVFAGAGMAQDPFNKIIVFDEAHKYMGGSLINHVVEVIREMRHKGVTAVIASQDPINIPPAIIELSSALILHRFNSPNWLRHIQKSLISLSELTPSMLAALQPGEAFVWANKSTDQVFTRRAVKVRMRPRVTEHGGSTRTAVSE